MDEYGDLRKKSQLGVHPRQRKRPASLQTSFDPREPGLLERPVTGSRFGKRNRKGKRSKSALESKWETLPS